MRHSKTSLKYFKLILAFCIFIALGVIGCAGESVRVELPANHPANPQALETQFVPPQNPFRTDVATEGEPAADVMLKHKTPAEKENMHQEHHQ